MLHAKSFVKKTRKGKVLKVVREHYLRDDIYSGSPLDPECDPSAYKLSPDAPHYLVIDTNVALHQMDFLEHVAIDDVIVTSVVLDEVRKRNMAAYQRLRALTTSPKKRFYVFANEHHRDTYVTADPGESPNDRNDRAIRVAAAWYAARLPTMKIVFLTDDTASRKLSSEKGIEAISTMQYAQLRASDAPELVDLVSAARSTEHSEREHKEGQGTKGRNEKRRRIYEEHRPMSEIAGGMKSGKYHQGTLRVNRFNPFEGWVGSESVGEDILVRGRVAMNRAMEGDVVAVELLSEEQWQAPSSRIVRPGDDAEDDVNGDDTARMREGDGATGTVGDGGDDGDEVDDVQGAHIAQVDPGEHYGGVDPSLGSSGSEKRPTGRVIGVIRRNWRTRGYCGSLHPPRSGGAYPSGTASVLFCPVERRYPMIRLQTRQANILADKRIVVVIDAWEADSAYPQGHYVRTLGDIGDKDVETEVVLVENDINTAPFTPAVHACVPPLPWRLSEADVADPMRADLRHLLVCSVDPPGCKDIDDALHVRRLENGNLEVGVHIADVTHFVHPGTAIDMEAATRATTTYLVQRRIDMLPKPLTEDICSLRANVDRLSFSVIWEISRETADVVSSHFTKSIIRSRAALTYEEAQTRIDDARLNDDLTGNLRLLNNLAKILRKKRAERGALQLASPEVKFEIDTETHDPLDVGMYQVRETNQMVEEMMLLANCTVAERCLMAFPSSSLLRRHPTPPPRQFEPLLRAATAVGLTMDCSTSKALAESLDKAVRAEDPYFNKLIRIMATRCMTQAVYFNSGEVSADEYHHYGLAAPLYTHFTSPIRRYADVIVHRVLMAALGIEPLPELLRDRNSMADVVDNLNLRHRNAQLAGRGSVELHTLVFFKEKSVVADARVTKVQSNGLIVFVPKFGIEGPIFFADDVKTSSRGEENDSGDVHPSLVFDVERQTISSSGGSIRFTIFDPCAVRISVKEGIGRRRALVLELVDRNALDVTDRVH